MIYLASPYQHAFNGVMIGRYNAVAKVTADLLREGHIIYSPIVHNHPLAAAYDLPRSFDFWMNIDLDILKRCDELWVLKLKGRESSKGVAAEVEFAKSINLPITYLEHDVG